MSRRVYNLEINISLIRDLWVRLRNLQEEENPAFGGNGETEMRFEELARKENTSTSLQTRAETLKPK